MSPAEATGSAATSIAPEESAVAPSARRITRTLAPALLAESAAIAPAIPAPITTTSGIPIGSVQVADRQVVATVELFLRQLVSVQHRSLRLEPGLQQAQQLAMSLFRRQSALACEERGGWTGALRPLARPHGDPAAAAQIDQVPDVLLADAVRRLGIGSLLTGTERGAQLRFPLHQLADLHRVRPVAIGHPSHHGFEDPVVAGQILDIGKRFSSRQWFQMRSTLATAVQLLAGEVGHFLALEPIRGELSSDQREEVCRALRAVVVNRMLAGKGIVQLAIFVESGAKACPGAQDPGFANGWNDALDAFDQVFHFILRHLEVVRIAVEVRVGRSDHRRIRVRYDEDLSAIDRAGDDSVVRKPPIERQVDALAGSDANLNVGHRPYFRRPGSRHVHYQAPPINGFLAAAHVPNADAFDRPSGASLESPYLMIGQHRRPVPLSR